MPASGIPASELFITSGLQDKHVNARKVRVLAFIINNILCFKMFVEIRCISCISSITLRQNPLCDAQKTILVSFLLDTAFLACQNRSHDMT